MLSGLLEEQIDDTEVKLAFGGFDLLPIHRQLDCVGVQGLDTQGSCLLGPIGVDLNAVAMSGYAMQQVSERHAIADAGIERRESLWEG